MKIRNGFVSNSSSSSYIINYPLRELRLKDVEDYIGGYTENTPDRYKDIMSYLIWKNQPKWNKGKTCKYDLYNIEGDDWCCDGDDCSNCDVMIAPTQKDKDKQVNSVLERGWYCGEAEAIIEGFRNREGILKGFSLDDNNPSDYDLTYDEADYLTAHAGKMFASNNNIIGFGK